jgi:hypothetical protein
MIMLMLIGAAQAAVAAPPAKAKAPAEKMRCQLIYQANSRIPDRLCLTQAEWDKMADANRDDLASSRNAHSAGNAGTIVSYSGGEASIGAISPGNTKGPGPH